MARATAKAVTDEATKVLKALASAKIATALEVAIMLSDNGFSPGGLATHPV